MVMRIPVRLGARGMTMVAIPRRGVGLLLVLCIVLVPLAAAGAEVAGSLLTNSGDTFDGTFSGVGATLRLEIAPPIVNCVPIQIYKIPVGSIRQITIDFPRVVVEADDTVYIGPYAAFKGIPEIVGVRQDDLKEEIPITTVRAMTFGDAAFRAPPRVWMRDGFLVMSLTAAPAVTGYPTRAAAPSFASTPYEPDEREIRLTAPWEETYAPITTTTRETPDWVVPVILGAAVVLILYLLSSSGTSP